jgi:pilus assembly protein CpaC
MKTLSINHSLASTILNTLFSVAAAFLIAMVSIAPVKAQTSSAIQSTPLNLSTIKSNQQKTNNDTSAKKHLSQLGVTVMDLTLGKSTLLKLPAPITRISVGSPSIADVMMVSPREVYILGKLIGMTNITLWTKDGKSKVIDVAVLMDATKLHAQLLEIMPSEQDIKVTAAGDSLVLSGFVSNTVMVDRAIALADAFIRTSVLNMMVNLGGGKKDGDAGGGAGGQQGMQVLRQGIQSRDDSPGAGGGLGSFKVINLLQVRDNQQVMLEVKVAEVNRTEAEKLGFEFQRALGKAGSAWTQIMAGVIGGGIPSILAGEGVASEYAKFGEGNFLIDAEKRDEVIKVLAEPNIVAISGQEASFLVGGEILIPVTQGVGGVRLQSKQFGVSLRFTPTVLEEGRINLNVNPEVSELVGFEEVASSGVGSIVAVPTFRTRRISTTVQLRDGQSLAIGGLLQDDFKEQLKRFPILGEIPILGALFRSSSFEMGKTELMIIVTPRLVKPLQPGYTLPTDSFIRPGRGEFLLQGRMESATDDSETADTGDLNNGKEPNYPAGTGGFQMK